MIEHRIINEINQIKATKITMLYFTMPRIGQARGQYMY